MLRALQNQRRKSADAGFTLIELLIVIVILGILAAIVVFSVRGITDRGTTAACKADIATVNTAEEAYYAKNGKYGTLADLTTAPNILLASVPDTVTVTNTATTYSVTGKAGTNRDCTGITLAS